MVAAWVSNRQDLKVTDFTSSRATVEPLASDLLKKFTDDYVKAIVAASLNQPISIRFVFSAYTMTDPLKNTALSRQTEWGTVYRESSSAIISDDFNRETLERLAIENPAHLLEIVNNASLTPPLLTYAAEYLGNIKDKDEGLAERIVESLLRLTENMSALVREGAIYGLEDYLDRPDVAERLTQIIASDSSPGVKAAAQEALEE